MVFHEFPGIQIKIDLAYLSEFKWKVLIMKNGKYASSQCLKYESNIFIIQKLQWI